ncbi:MAG: hypothetical protein KAS32_22330 [Candidatus Peribacteraceae bacterium]|nr:hypothetical protein [Candidatus Peribacteraceae bacterium]
MAYTQGTGEYCNKKDKTNDKATIAYFWKLVKSKFSGILMIVFHQGGIRSVKKGNFEDVI